MSNVTSFLDKIQELNNKVVSVLVPSKGKKVEFTPLSFKQQKDIISTITDNSTGVLKFQKYLNDIIISNAKDPENILITDKYSVIIQLRVDAIGDTVKINDEGVKLTPILERIKTLKKFDGATVTFNDLTVELSIPTVAQENKIFGSLIENIKKDANEIELGKNVSTVYTYEILKYIKCIKFGEEVLVFEDINIKDRYNIVENLPLSLNKEIISFIQTLKKQEFEFLTFDVGGESHVLDIDVGFFDS